ncbi:hypothetical protein PR202_ga21169 [Eleusine coracana subsp. coracana]|uniref:Uncharacterized protein n=1 Tax=Eleusine coracana subsp. coracana TaxID=191504 RepID=A0AAV5D0N7_ELECO|nr:hypothetical protein PR202_ga21169 [Eleusine coracana subsp. coracana]
MPAHVGLPPPAPHHLMPHIAGQGTEDAIDVEASAGRDLLRHRVLPPTGLGVQLPPFVAEPVQIDDDDFSDMALLCAI